MFPKAVKFSVGAQSQYLGILCALLYTFHESNTITFSFSYTWGILIYFQVLLPLEANCRYRLMELRLQWLQPRQAAEAVGFACAWEEVGRLLAASCRVPAWGGSWGARSRVGLGSCAGWSLLGHVEIKASAAGCGVQEGRAGGRSGRNLGGRIDGKWSFFQVSEALTSCLGRTEAESEVIPTFPTFSCWSHYWVGSLFILQSWSLWI